MFHSTHDPTKGVHERKSSRKLLPKICRIEFSLLESFGWVTWSSPASKSLTNLINFSFLREKSSKSFSISFHKYFKKNIFVKSSSFEFIANKVPCFHEEKLSSKVIYEVWSTRFASDSSLKVKISANSAKLNLKEDKGERKTLVPFFILRVEKNRYYIKGKGKVSGKVSWCKEKNFQHKQTETNSSNLWIKIVLKSDTRKLFDEVNDNSIFPSSRQLDLLNSNSIKCQTGKFSELHCCASI